MTRLSYIILLLTCCSNSFSQLKKDIKPKGFDKISNKIELKQGDFFTFFNKNLNDSVTINFSDAFVFKGKIISIVKRFDNFHTVVIASQTMNNTILSLNKVSYEGVVSYTGMIFNSSYDDGFMLKKDSRNNYILEKFFQSIQIQD
jgi:hypothetical protein